MGIKLYNKGSDSVSTDFNYNVPTNPRITTESTYSSTTRIFSILYPEEPSSAESFSEVISSAGLLTTYYNLTATKGFRIRCYESLSQTGISLSSISKDSNGRPDTDYYFVLIYSNDENMHHFAKITTIENEDEDGDSFEFTPALGSEIPRDTQFMLFKGPPLTSSALAFTAGIKNELQNFLTLARPIFYFDDSFDKENELDHNTKYFLRMNGASSGSSVSVSVLDTTFLTAQDFSNVIVDYSPYTMKVTLTDNLRTQDDPAVNTSNEGYTIPTKDFTDYGAVFHNARRDAGDNIVVLTYTGPTRYAHYDFSPVICNKVEGVINSVIKESVGDRAGLAESKLIDNYRILPSKVVEGEPYRIRHDVFRGNLNDWKELDIELDTYSAYISGGGTKAQYTIKTSYSDSTDFLNSGDEVKIGDKICVVHNITTSVIRFKIISRKETESNFTSDSLTSLSGEKVYRRAYNATDKTLLTDFDIIDNRDYNLYVKLNQDPFSLLYASISSSDKNKKLLTLSFDGSSYSTNPLEYSQGNYIISIERFIGEVENIESYKENGQTFMEIVGRDTYSKLLSPIVNSNTLFSEDIIYSHDSFYNNLQQIIGAAFNCTYDSKSITFTGVINHTLSVGNKLYGEYASGSIAYVGTVAVVNSLTEITLDQYPRIEASGSTALSAYKIKEQNYVFNKALSSNYRNIDTVTSLDGSSEKGVIFTGGVKITSTGNDGESLINTSSNANANALGYPIFEPNSMKSDKAFQAKLKETTAESFGVVNTLNDFTILITQKEENFTLIEVAPYVPLTLGRVEYNYLDTQDTTLVSDGTVSAATDSRFLTVSGLSTLYEYEEPVFVDGVFVGYHIQTNFYGPSATLIFLDRKATVSAGNLQKISYKTSTLEEKNKFSYSLNLLNGAHLHGGKNIALLNSMTMDEAVPNNGNALALMDFPIVYDLSIGLLTTSRETYINKYGLPMYRIYEVEKGNYNPYYSTVTSKTDDKDFLYYNTPSQVKYYANAYRFGSAYYLDGGLYKDSLVGVGKTGDVSLKENTSLVETRGYKPASGSRFFDTKHHPNLGSADVVYKPTDITGSDKSPFRAKDYLNQIDPKIARMFLFVNSDLLPYSNTRRDALMNSSKTRDISNYNMVLMKNPTSRENSTNKQSTTVTNVISNVDSDYITCDILSADKEINSLNSFSIMRLTEVAYDWAFNQIDPENLPEKNRTVGTFYYPFSNITSTGLVVAASDYNGLVITVPADPTSIFSSGDIVLDADGNEIGEVDSVSASPNEITLEGNAMKTSDGNYFAGTLHKLESVTSIVSGNGKFDSFVNRVYDMSMLKGAIIGDRSSYGSASGSAWYDWYGSADTYPTFSLNLAATDIVIPVNLGDALYFNYYPNHHPSKILKMFNGDDSSNQWESDFMNRQMQVTLGTYPIEDEITTKNVIGMVSAPMSGTNTSKVHKASSSYTNVSRYHSVTYKTTHGAGAYIHSNLNATTTERKTFGSIMGFKFRLKLDDSTRTADKSVGNTDVYHYIIETSTANKNKWLDLVNDLTGCYLVSEKGRYVDIAKDGTYLTLTANQDNQGSLNNVSPDSIGYVLSHEIDIKAFTVTHKITVDNALPTDYYRIMQPNHTCFENKTPNTISLNKLSSAYTKMAYSDDMYSNISAWRLKDLGAEQFFGNASTDGNSGGSEALLSMYVLIDTDKRESTTSPTHVVIRDRDKVADLVSTDEKLMCISDGENSVKSTIRLIKTDLGYDMAISEIKKMIGVVSISDIITVKLGNDISEEYNRAMIGAGVQISSEVDSLLNEFLETNDIEFSLPDLEYPQFISPNFQGLPLFSAVNYLTSLKKQAIVKENEKFVIKKKDSNDFYADVVLTDDGEYQIFDYQRKSTIFDKFNEVIVYGARHRATRKNLKDINKSGRKTIEIFERELSTQSAVDSRATDLLALYNKDNIKIQIEVGHKGINQIRVGDIIGLELKRENIPLNHYLVLELEHLLAGNIKMTLGKYSKQLEDRFSDLIIQNKRTDTAIRQDSFAVNQISNDFLQDIKIKPLRLLVRKRESTGTVKLGFGTKLGFSTTLGFYGSLVITDLLEEEY